MTVQFNPPHLVPATGLPTGVLAMDCWRHDDCKLTNNGALIDLPRSMLHRGVDRMHRLKPP